MPIAFPMTEKETLSDLIIELKMVITSIESDMSLGCLSTVPNSSVLERLNKIDNLITILKDEYNYDTSALAVQSGCVTIARRKHF